MAKATSKKRIEKAEEAVKVLETVAKEVKTLAEAENSGKAARPAAGKVPEKEVQKAVVKEEPAAKEPAAKAPAEKAPAEKAPEAKAAETKKTEAKVPAMNTEIFVQYWGKEVKAGDIVENIKKVWTGEMGKKLSEIQDLKVYIKPEDNGAHYVINGDITGFVAM